MSVKVAVRSRPMSDQELKAKAEVIVRMNGNEVELRGSVDGHGGKFLYDSALWSTGQVVNGSSNAEASQAYVYNAIGAELLEHIMTGYNGCIFAYGQTGSGKTYCMMGRDKGDPGLIPRIAQSLFEHSVALREQNVEVCVEVSYYEIYKEKVRCLLRPTQGGYDDTRLRVREHPKYGPFIEGLAKFVVNTPYEFLNLMRDGNKVRSTASTAMNQASSRSHAVFAITLTQKQQNGNLITQKTSRLNLVDLAGSERASKTLATGKLLTEGATINQSLTCLGNVISALAEEEESGKSRHIPYRDSTLTWILKDNLGGNSKTVMLATISPSSLQYEETLSTLRYAERAKKIVNKAVVNETNNNEVIAALQKEIWILKSQLANASMNERERLQEELEASEAVKKELTSSLGEKLTYTKRLMEEREEYMHRLELKLSAQTEEIEELRRANEEKERRIDELLQRIHSLAASGSPPDSEKVERIQELVAALEQEQSAAATHMKEKQPQKPTCASLDSSEDEAESHLLATAKLPGRLNATKPNTTATLAAVPETEQSSTAVADMATEVPVAVRAAIQKTHSAFVVHSDANADDVDHDLVLESPYESADEDLTLDEEVQRPAPADSDLEDIPTEDSALELPPKSPWTRDSETDDLLADPDIVLDDSVGEPPVTPVGDAFSAPASTPSSRIATSASTAAVVTASLTADATPSAKPRAALSGGPVVLSQASTESPRPRPVSGKVAHALSYMQGAKNNGTHVTPRDFFTQSSERPEIYPPNARTAQLVISSQALPNNRYLHEPFRAINLTESSPTGRKTSCVCEMDMFRGRFCILETTGVQSFDLPCVNLFRVEKDPRHSRRLTLYFLDALHLYVLEFGSTVRRQQFFELAMLMRRNSVLWCPSLCVDGENDVAITVKGTTLERPGNRDTSVTGEVKMTVARMPYEVIDMWYGCFSLEGKPLPRSVAVFSGFFPKDQREIYVIGVIDVPVSLLGNDELASYFLAYIGASTYFVLANTAISSGTHHTSNAMLVVCKRSFLVRVANIQLLEAPSLRKEGVCHGDFTATGCSLRINESFLCVILVNAKPGTYTIQNRAACIRSLLSSFPFGKTSVDISMRFDYFIVSGAFNFGGDFSTEDALIREILADNLMSNMREMEPSPTLSSAPSPLRVFYAVRPSVSRMDMSVYSTSRALRFANVFFSADIFCQRSFLSLFGEGVPRVQLLLSDLTIKGGLLPPTRCAELQVSLDVLEGSPTTFRLSSQDGEYVIPDSTDTALYPCVSNIEYLRLQTLTFSLLDRIGPAETHKHILVASGIFPLKSVTLAEPALLHIALYYEGCAVGTLTAVLLQFYHERSSAELSTLGLPNARYATILSCYENEVRRASAPWTPASIVDDGIFHFSAEDPTKSQERGAYSLPDPHAWRWTTEWQHDHREDDQQGWVYAYTVGADLQLSATDSSRIRRRRWVRVMQASGPIAYHTYLAERLTTAAM
ncbi:putative Unc104-like kinesin [Leishmania mexicana MHOM/GT/2001/U1103]|uniref:Unc104-like kinesin n=1 Tax=Leishmania mexicana (strain MHOM/GT/2001/U1103) TaxID=929439 RepID=E9B5M1_LEIMU|nr:putative Unc104-like kinesin [Leishmania mexicana MHOM/GT/2001/U1103]CBZ30541.1 putative Unc104-like kinesin [Leishmania mexicana MHOM/GT/2001/U1103]